MTTREKKEIQTTIRAIVNRLVASFDIEKIVLFGSYVTGRQTKDSDIATFCDRLSGLNREVRHD